MLERPQQLLGHALLRRPREGQALDALGVGVLRGREPALGQRELAQDVVERLLDDLAVALLPRDDPGVEVGGGEQRVVVEHLLEVRRRASGVDRVAVEAAADQVVHAAGGHARRASSTTIGSASSSPRGAAEQELERRGGRELRRAAEAAVDRVELRPERTRGLGEQALGQRVARGLDARPARRPRAPCACRLDVGALLAVGVRDGLEQLREARQPVPRLRREVRAAEERLAVRRQEDRHRPAAAARSARRRRPCRARRRPAAPRGRP